MIRKIEVCDKEAYIKMAKDFYSGPAVLCPVPDSYFDKTFNEIILGSPFAVCYVYENNFALSAYVLLAVTWSQEAGGKCVWLEEIYVEPHLRNKGIGTELIEYVKKNVPAARYRLETEPQNIKAAQLYKKLGFKPLDYENYYLSANNI